MNAGRLDDLALRALQWATVDWHAAYSLAVVRVMVGGIILSVLLGNAADRHYLWGSASSWVDSEVAKTDVPLLFDLFFPKDDPVAFDLAYVALVITALVFVAGWRTRFVTPVLLVLWQSLAANSTLLDNSGDTVLRLALVFLLFADLSRHWSVDSVLERRRGRPRRRLLVPWVDRLIHNTALVLLCAQLLTVYIVSSQYKLQDPAWLNGTASYYPLVLDAYRPFPAVSELAYQWGPGVIVATYVSFAAQLLLPVLLLWRPTRIGILIVVTGMHLAIGLLVGLWAFSLIMIALDLLFIRDSTWRSVGRRMRRTPPARASAAPTTLGEWSPPYTAATGQRRSPS